MVAMLRPQIRYVHKLNHGLYVGCTFQFVLAHFDKFLAIAIYVNAYKGPFCIALDGFTLVFKILGNNELFSFSPQNKLGNSEAISFYSPA
jgi:hypothetical protein